VPDALVPLSSYRSPSSACARRFANLAARGREAPDLSVFLGRTDRDLAIDFRALLTCRARSAPLGCYPSRAADALLDFVLSRVCRPRRWPGFRPASSRASADASPGEGLRACLHSGVLLVCRLRGSAVVASSLSRVPSPSEVSRLLWSPPFGTARSWVTPRGRPSVTGGRYPSSERGGTLLTPGVTTDWRPD